MIFYKADIFYCYKDNHDKYDFVLLMTVPQQANDAMTLFGKVTAIRND